MLLGQPLYQPMPRIVGVRLTGELPRGSTATDLVLVVTEMLRSFGVVGAFVEFAGDGLASLALADRATIANMSPEFGATSTLFPIDDETLTYLRLTGRPAELVDLVERYARAQGLWREPGPGPEFDARLELDLATRRPVRGRAAAAPGPGAPRGPAGELPDVVPERLPGVGDRGRPIRDDRRGRHDRRPGQRQRRDRGRRPAGRDPVRLGRDRRDHLVHQHVQPHGHGRRRPARPQRGRPRPDRRAEREDVPRAGLQGGDRLPRDRRAHGSAGRPRVRPGRLRLHDLHRQLGPARGCGRGSDRGARPGRRRGPVGQPQLRGPDPPAGPGQLSRLAAPRRRLRPRRPGRHRPHDRAPRDRPGRPGRDARRPVAVARRDQAGHRHGHRPGTLPADVRHGLRRGRPLARAADPGRRPVRLGGRLDVRREATVLRGADRPTGRARRTSTAPASWPSSATRSRPTTSARPGRSPPRRRPAAGSRSTAWDRSTSTRTGPAAATTR